MSSAFAQLDSFMTTACFAQLSDDDEAIFTPAGSSVGVSVHAQLDWEVLEVGDGTVAVERRPVVKMPASVGPIARGATVRINGHLYRIAQLLINDGQEVQAVCDA